MKCKHQYLNFIKMLMLYNHTTLCKKSHVFRKKFRFYILSKMRAIFIREIDVFLKFFSKFYQQNFFTGENTQFFKIFVDFVFWFYPFEIAFFTSKNQSKFRGATPGDFRNFKIWIFYLKWHRFAQGGVEQLITCGIGQPKSS